MHHLNNSCSERFLIELVIWAYIYYPTSIKVQAVTSTEAPAPISSNNASNMVMEKRQNAIGWTFSISRMQSVNTHSRHTVRCLCRVYIYIYIYDHVCDITNRTAVDSIHHSLQICNLTNSWLKIASLIPHDPLLMRLMVCCILLNPNQQNVFLVMNMHRQIYKHWAKSSCHCFKQKRRAGAMPSRVRRSVPSYMRMCAVHCGRLLHTDIV